MKSLAHVERNDKLDERLNALGNMAEKLAQIVGAGSAAPPIQSVPRRAKSSLGTAI